MSEAFEKKKKAPKTEAFRYNFNWWVIRDSNPRPSRCKRDALAN